MVLETEDVNGVMVTQDLTTLERDILELLVINSGMFVTHNRFGQIKVNGDYFDPNNLKTHISHIRRKIKNGRGHVDPHKIIEAKQGVGYRLNVYPPRVE